MNLTSPNESLHLADKAAHTADQAIRATQRAANSALDGLADGAQELRERAVPALNRAADNSSELAHRGVQAIRERSRQVRESARRASDGTVGYVRDEPLKSLLIAVSVGAVLGLLMGRRARD